MVLQTAALVRSNVLGRATSCPVGVEPAWATHRGRTEQIMNKVSTVQRGRDLVRARWTLAMSGSVLALACLAGASGGLLPGVVSVSSTSGVTAAASLQSAGEGNVGDWRGGRPLVDAWEDLVLRFGGSKSDTRATEDVTLSFNFATDVGQIPVNGGDEVSKGQVLVRANDNVIVAGLELQELRAQSTLEIQAALGALELAQFRFDQAELAMEEGQAVSASEREELRITLEQTKLSVEQARMNHRQENLRYDQARAQADTFELKAPFDGIVEEVYVSTGQGVEGTQPVVRLVNTTRLRLDPYPPTAVTTRFGLRGGSPAWVLTLVGEDPVVVRGEVAYVSPIADSVSQTRRVRVEFDNPGDWPAGTQAVVRFSEPGPEWDRFRMPDGDAESGAAVTASQSVTGDGR